jgi:ribosome-binding protein aMBF1 (putative translation factor)
MSTERAHRRLNRKPKDVARLKAVRERYQKEKPTVEQLLAEGGHKDTTPLGELLLVHRIAHRIKEERRRQAMSLAVLSKKTGIDAAALSRLENGRQANPTLDTLQRVAAALGKQLVCDFQET